MNETPDRLRRLPPPARLQPVVDTWHGQAIVDPYRWLEGGPGGVETAEVTTWTDAQNAHTRAVLDHLPGRRALEDRLRPLMQIDAITAPIVRGDRYFYSRRSGDQNQPVIYCRRGHAGVDVTLIDPGRLDASGLTTVEWCSPSPDGTRLAYGTYRAGDEQTTLRLLDVDTGRALPLEIPGKTQAPEWLPDGSGFVYRNLELANDPYSARIRFHRLGTPVADDLVIFRQYTADENPALATTWGPFATLSQDGAWLLLGYWIDTRSSDLWLVDMRACLANGRATLIPVSEGVVGHGTGTVIDGTLFLQTTKGAPRGRVIAVSASSPASSHWRDVVPEREDAVIQAIGFARGLIVVTYLRHAANVTEVFDTTGRSLGVIRQPGIGSTTIAVEEDRTEGFLTFTSFHHVPTIFRVDLRVPDAAPVVWQQPVVPADFSRVQVEQVWYRSKDGTPISMFVVQERGRSRNADTPALLTGYGGFNISLTPAFVPTLLPWFDAGGLLAVSNLRGGGEYGDAWHEAGTQGRKQNTFDDFIAAAEWLVGEGYTRPDRLAVQGGSNGGLLTGAFLTQRPELCRVALVLVPLLDMLRYQDFLMARYWVPEYGTAERADQFPYLRAYSPYHRVTSGTTYPAVFLTAGEHDSRVHPMHARKMAASLQVATAHPADRPVLLWIDRDAGHGQGKPLDLRIRDVVDQRLFTMWQLGMLGDAPRY